MNLQLKSHKILLFSIGLLLMGSLYYLLFRQAIIASSYFGLEFLHVALFSPTLNALPSFVHQLAFVLLTWLAFNKSHKYFALLFWLITNSLFELGQLLNTQDASYLPQTIEHYLKNGTYSHGDMIAIFFATFVAYIIIKNQKEN